MRITVCMGTRPEAIKLAPVVHELRSRPGIDVDVLATAQHRELLDQVLDVFDIAADVDLDIMQPNQTLPMLTARLLTRLSDHIRDTKPDWVIVQGDTTTAFTAALAAFYEGSKVAHVEAGLRTGNPRNPFPEEMNRRLVGPLASVHFPPTASSASSLLEENVAAKDIHIVGNTVIDALFSVLPRARAHQPADDIWTAKSGRRLILATGHRRENFGDGQAAICRGLGRLAAQFDDVDIVYPVHPNPNVRKVVADAFDGSPNVHLIEPLDYLTFVAMMERATLIISDSGGVQEEAPAVGTPVLVSRTTTERPEAVESGAAILVGTDEEKIVQVGAELLTDDEARLAMTADGSPFGDGRASARIADVLERGETDDVLSELSEITKPAHATKEIQHV